MTNELTSITMTSHSSQWRAAVSPKRIPLQHPVIWSRWGRNVMWRSIVTPRFRTFDDSVIVSPSKSIWIGGKTFISTFQGHIRYIWFTSALPEKHDGVKIVVLSYLYQKLISRNTMILTFMTSGVKIIDHTSIFTNKPLLDSFRAIWCFSGIQFKHLLGTYSFRDINYYEGRSISKVKSSVFRTIFGVVTCN